MGEEGREGGREGDGTVIFRLVVHASGLEYTKHLRLDKCVRMGVVIAVSKDPSIPPSAQTIMHMQGPLHTPSAGSHGMHKNLVTPPLLSANIAEGPQKRYNTRHEMLTQRALFALTPVQKKAR